MRGDRPPAQARRHARRPRAEGPARPRPQAHRQGLHPAGVRALLRRPRARGARTSPTRVVTVSPDVGTSTNLGGWINKAGIWSIGDRIDWFADDTDTLVRWREHDHGRHIELGIAEVNLVGLLGRAGRDLVARRPAAAARRHDLRPVRLARAGAVVVRHLRRRPVDPRRHALRRHARPRGRRAPVGDHAVDRHRAARLRRLRARLRPGLRVVLPARALPARQARRHSAYFRLSTRPIDQSPPHRHARGGARRRLQAASARRARRSDRRDGRARPRGARRRRHAQRGRGPGRRGRLHHQRRPAVPLLPGPLRPRRRRPATRSSSCSARASRSSASSTATRTRSLPGRRRSPASACSASARPATSSSSTSTTRSTPSRSSAPLSTCWAERVSVTWKVTARGWSRVTRRSGPGIRACRTSAAAVSAGSGTCARRREPAGPTALVARRVAPIEPAIGGKRPADAPRRAVHGASSPASTSAASKPRPAARQRRLCASRRVRQAVTCRLRRSRARPHLLTVFAAGVARVGAIATDSAVDSSVHRRPWR